MYKADLSTLKGLIQASWFGLMLHSFGVQKWIVNWDWVFLLPQRLLDFVKGCLRYGLQSKGVIVKKNPHQTSETLILIQTDCYQCAFQNLHMTNN